MATSGKTSALRTINVNRDSKNMDGSGELDAVLAVPSL
ncbi:hypothetical protein EYZ11_010289 [Aspergillus tanneri]|uniref:Uncharacterized protein n=1 Tax=Aspergillus tanneri TaxID=1220188 RepID=A0A4S3J5P0_9EURO|nr:hypothetical protein EYZ11_010289 [Aspergillus tanneri]